jgi:UDP-glucose 4-epimerase
VTEDYAPMLPISTYGASKLVGEVLVCSYCHMFDMRGCAFRFANLVGPFQTHGVAFDFIRRLREDSNKLRVLGNGTQSKSYIYVDDIINAMLLLQDYSPKRFDYFHIATRDYLIVQEIAEIVIEEMGLNKANIVFEYIGVDRGWKGDVPIVRFDITKIFSTGLKPQYNSRQAIKRSIKEMLKDR